MEQSWIAGTALLLGALHAIEPGHSKTVIAAYIAGTHHSQRQALTGALVLGCSVALSHTLTIIALALLMQFAIASVTGETAHQWLQGLSAGLTMVLGAVLFRQAYRKRHHQPHKDCCEKHSVPKTSGYAMLSLIGVGGGLVPCPSALAALLSAGAGGQLARGVWVVMLFSCGIALTLMMVAIIARSTHQTLQARFIQSQWENRLPLVSALLIFAVGVISLLKLCLTLA